jgi:hypothetical protein
VSVVSSEVQRTLVKSPPELWAELSDPAALARHLGELGEIRITNTKPEERVEWEADGATGTVLIKASGWGTKVTLSATRELQDATIDCDDDADEPVATTEPETAPVVEAIATPIVEEIPQPEPIAPPEPAAEPRRGFFARLFRRPAAMVEESAPVEVQAPEPEQAAPEELVHTPVEPAALEEPVEIAVEAPAEPPRDLSAELQAAEEAATEEVTAVLTAALDRLGAAHHRPFSRA